MSKISSVLVSSLLKKLKKGEERGGEREREKERETSSHPNFSKIHTSIRNVRERKVTQRGNRTRTIEH